MSGDGHQGVQVVQNETKCLRMSKTLGEHTGGDGVPEEKLAEPGWGPPTPPDFETNPASQRGFR